MLDYQAQPPVVTQCEHSAAVLDLRAGNLIVARSCMLWAASVVSIVFQHLKSLMSRIDCGLPRVSGAPAMSLAPQT
jgi:hypothetical protein